MFNCHYEVKIWKILVSWLVIVLGSLGISLWFDLSEEIYSKFQNFYNWGMSDEYISNVYSINLSKDPFWDAMSNVESKSMQKKIVGADYIEDLLNAEWCPMSKKKIWAILYYFVPEFRTEIARSLKQELWDYSSRKYVFDESEIVKYCEEYYTCVESRKDERTGWQQYRDFLKWNKGIVTSSTSEEKKTACQEFFQKNYREWQDNEERIQNVQVAELWADRYWNTTTDDSPYDIIIDLDILAKLQYWDAEKPITPVFYEIPAFSNSKNALKNSKSTKENQWAQRVYKGNWWWKGWVSLEGNWWWVSLGWNWVSLGQEAKQSDSSPSPLPIWITFEPEWWYDELLDWLSAFSVNKEKASFSYTSCDDEDTEEVESEWDKVVPLDTYQPGIAERDFDELSNKEYQAIIDYMLNSVNDYTKLPEKLEKDIESTAWDTSRYIADQSTSQLNDTANQIKKCRESCEWLRIDQKASCMIKCTCWEIHSPIFNPEETPWLWPIYMIKFCAVPWVDTKFSVWGKRIHSIEEWLTELYWAVDKLSREWRLWKWTQQYEFLDSSTKQMNISDSVAFTVDIEYVDTSDKMPIQSDQYKQRKIEQDNESWKWVYGVANPLNNPVTKNSYRIIWTQESIDYSLAANGDRNNQVLADLNKAPESMVEGTSNSDANRYNTLANYLSRWIDQQATLRTKVSDYTSEMDSYAIMLYSRRCKIKKH